MIGLFGGTFDPVHIGHLRAALEIKEAFHLDEVRLIPCSVPPHRPQPEASALHRLRMLELAIENRPDFRIDTRELERVGYSYMVDTLGSINKEQPAQSLLLAIGSDAFNGLTEWHEWRRLFDYAHIVVMTRPGFVAAKLNEFLETRQTTSGGRLRDCQVGKLYFQPITQLDVSASSIRGLLAEKRDPSFLLPDAVLEYIKINQLYGT